MPQFKYPDLDALGAQARARYRFDLARLPEQLLPYLLRRPRLLALVRAHLKPLAELYAQVLGYTIQTRRELSYNGQTMQLERALNDKFDPTLRRIRILNSQTSFSPLYLNYTREAQAAKYVYEQAEGKPGRYLYEYGEIVNQTGFTVRVPAALSDQELALRTRINQLKVALVKYRIVYFY